MRRGIITLSENGAVSFPAAPVWMTQQEMADMLQVSGYDIRKAVRTIYREKVFHEHETVRSVRLDVRRSVDVYPLEMVIAVAFRIGSRNSELFRNYIVRKMQATGSRPMVFLLKNGAGLHN